MKAISDPILPTLKKSLKSCKFQQRPSPPTALTHTAVEEEMDTKRETPVPSSFSSRTSCGRLKPRPHAGTPRPAWTPVVESPVASVMVVVRHHHRSPATVVDHHCRTCHLPPSLVGDGGR